MGHRERLLEGAQRCLREKGYARTTARDLVAASDTNLGSIGYHFGSKEALLNEAIGEAFRAWTERIAGAAFAAPDVDPLARLRASWIEMLTSFEEDRGLVSAFVEALAPAARSPELREQLAAQYQEGREAIGRMVAVSLGEAGGGVDAAVVASFLMAVCDGLMIQFLLDPENTPSGAELVDALEAGAAAAAGLRAS
jgi:AcrR family transcriptional regulator